MIGQNQLVVSRIQIPEIEHVVLETLEGKRRNNACLLYINILFAKPSQSSNGTNHVQPPPATELNYLKRRKPVSYFIIITPG